jgi:RNA polymerase sigma-70 factor (ECF subfamily)
VPLLNPMDEEIRACLAGKRYTEAFELVLSQYQNKIFRLAYSILANRELAEETAQEIFVRIWRALPGYRGLASISTWIYTIARNTCLTVLKNGSGRRTLSLDEPRVRDAAERRRALLAGDDLRGPDLEYLVSQLPEKYRRVIRLYYMEERSYEEVARLLDLPLGTVKTYLHRAKKELAAAMKQNKITEGGR